MAEDPEFIRNCFTFFTTINLYSHRDVTNPSFRMETNTSGKNPSVWTKEMFYNSCSVAVAKKGLGIKEINKSIKQSR